LKIRFAMIGYKDKGDDYVTKPLGFTSDIASMKGYVNQFSAGGGGDAPEAVREALEDLQKLPWSTQEVSTRLAVLVADAPPHGLMAGDGPSQKDALLALMGNLERQKVKVCTVLCEPVATETRWFMETLADKTGGKAIGLKDATILADFITAKAKADVSRTCLKWRVQQAASSDDGTSDEDLVTSIAESLRDSDITETSVIYDGRSETSGGATSVSTSVSTEQREVSEDDIRSWVSEVSRSSSSTGSRSSSTGRRSRSGSSRTGKGSHRSRGGSSRTGKSGSRSRSRSSSTSKKRSKSRRSEL
jgi:hypothetical protein